MNRNLIELLQVSVGTRDELSRGLTDSEWNEIYRLAESQGLIGILFGGIERLPKEQTPFMDLLMDLLGQTEYLKTQNDLGTRGTRR